MEFVFPLRRVPSQAFWKPPLGFGSDRAGGRIVDEATKRVIRPAKQKHSACDLAASPGTPVLSVGDGVVVRLPSNAFYTDPPQKGHAEQKPIPTYDLVVWYDGFLVRYCEIRKTVAKGVKRGAAVSAGQEIAYVSEQNTGTELHLEMFAHVDDITPLDVTDNYDRAPKRYKYVADAHYHRRADLLDPTPFLNLWPPAGN